MKNVLDFYAMSLECWQILNEMGEGEEAVKGHCRSINSISTVFTRIMDRYSSIHTNVDIAIDSSTHLCSYFGKSTRMMQ